MDITDGESGKASEGGSGNAGVWSEGTSTEREVKRRSKDKKKMRKKKRRYKIRKKKRRRLTKRGQKEAIKCKILHADPTVDFRRLLEENKEVDFGQERTTLFD